MYDAFNYTFIALIPKSDDPQTFNDFRPISLCNCIYKIIAKIIVNHLKPILSKFISHEQFAFLNHRKIHEVVGIAQEVLLSIKTKRLKAMILNIDLAKAFDRTSWLYLRILLTHLGFPFSFIQWIMCCITNVSYSVLINGTASSFFHVERGLRQCYPLSPLLFLFVMEGLS